MSGTDNSKGTGQSQVRCSDIQDLLFDYMSHELGQARVVLVREHLRKCADCTRHAAEIQATLDLLNQAGKETSDLPSRLTDERRRKLYWSITHPAMLWIEQHHVLASLIVTILIAAAAVLIMARIKLWEPDPEEDIFPVWIGNKLPDMTNSPAIPDAEGTAGEED